MASRKQPSRLPNYETVALVLQGGGALGAYQAGVYEGLHEAGIRPNWVSGISIGSINAAIIAGSPEEERVARLRGFWEAICRPTGFAGLPWGETLAGMFDGMPFGFGSPVVTGQLAAFRALTQGQPGFFTPRVPSPYLLRDSGAAGSVLPATAATRTPGACSASSGAARALTAGGGVATIGAAAGSTTGATVTTLSDDAAPAGGARLSFQATPILARIGACRRRRTGGQP